MYQRSEHGFGAAGGTALLSLDSALPARPAFGRAPLRERVVDLDLVVDLGARIGSRAWWRGLATCTALCTAAIALRPGFRPLDIPAEPVAGEAEWQEARTLAITPLALGADTGRRMAPTAAVQPLADTPERPQIELTATLGQGDGFARVLRRNGVSDADADAAADLVAQAVPLGDVASGTRFDIVLGRRPNRAVARPLERLEFRARLELKLLVERAGDRLTLRRIAIPVDDTPLRIRGRVGASLYLSARAAGVPGHAIETYLKALATRVSVSGIGRDATYDIIVAHRRAATGETETGELLYAGLDDGRRRTQLMKWALGGREQWFEASGVGQKTGGMTRPVQGHLTSSFGMRFHPLLGYSRMHQGIDLGAPFGSPIVAAAEGTITYAGWHGGHGNYVMVTHGGGIKTGYGHMSRIVARIGARVAQGQLIGYVGSTGLSTGPHLHYEVYRNNVPVNPTTFAFSTVSQIAGADLARFRAKLAGLLGVRTQSAAAPDKATDGTAPRSAKSEVKDRSRG